MPSRDVGTLMRGIFGDVDGVSGSNGWKTQGLKPAIFAKFGLEFGGIGDGREPVRAAGGNRGDR